MFYAMCLVASVLVPGLHAERRVADAGSPAEPESVTVLLRPYHPGATIHSAVLGINEFVLAPIVPKRELYEAAGIRGVRYPGGSTSDEFEWNSGAICGSATKVAPEARFDRFMSSVVQPNHLDAEITVNFGTSNQPSCDAAGSPEAAAEWVRYANNVRHYGITWWELGNEVWGSWERDVHKPPHDAGVFSSESYRYSSLMKMQDSSIHIGVPLVDYRSVDSSGTEWNSYVLSHAAYDYVSLHSYTERSGEESDAQLLGEGPRKVAASIERIRSQLRAAGRPDAPISVSEWNSVYGGPGKQSVSIVNGLYAAEVLGTLLESGVRRAEFWNTFGCEYGGHGNYSEALYGWQHFGSLGAFAEGVPFATPASGCFWDRTDTVQRGALFPTARAFELLSKSGFVTEGERMIQVDEPHDLGMVRAFGCTHGSGYGVLLLNLDPSSPLRVTLDIEGRPTITQYRWTTYGKEQYDRTARGGPWVGPETGSQSTNSLPIVFTLPPWSMSVVMFERPAG